MIITDDFLLGVSSYEILAVADAKGHYTKFTFHLPQWWKRDKVIKVRWANGVEPQAAQELRARLIYHFQVRKYAA